MGLDNGFIVRKKDDEQFRLEIAYFRKFQELDDYITLTCNKINDSDVYEVPIDVLEDLRDELLPIAKILIQIPSKLLSKYDDTSYPKKYKLDDEELIRYDFNPLTSNSMFAGFKTLKLYNAVCTMINFLEDDWKHEYYIEFYSSY